MEVTAPRSRVSATADSATTGSEGAVLAELGSVLDAAKALVAELEELVAFTNPDGEFVKSLGQAQASVHIWKALFQLPVDEDE